MLKEKLKKALKEAGLKEGLADFINITEESQIEGIVNSLKSTPNPDDVTPDFSKILASKEFAEFVSKNGFDNVVKLSKPLQSEHDKKVTSGIKTFKEKYFKQIETSEEMNEDGTPKAPKSDDMPAWAKAMMEKVEGLEKSKTKESKQEQAKKAITASKSLPDTIKEKWLSRIDLESETSFEDQVKAMETEYQEIHTGIVGKTAGNGLPFGGQQTGEVTDEEANDVVDSIV